MYYSIRGTTSLTRSPRFGPVILFPPWQRRRGGGIVVFVVVVIPKVEDTGIEKEPTHAQSDTRNSRSDHGGGAVEDEGGWGGKCRWRHDR